MATTGLGVLSLLAERDALIAETAKTLKSPNPAEIAVRAAAQQAEMARMRREIEALNAKVAASKLEALEASAKPVGALSLLTADMGAMSMDAARTLCDTIKEKANAVGVIAIHEGERLNFLAVCGADAVRAGAHAGNLLRAVSAIAGGKGGGRPDSATSGGRDLTKIGEALAAAEGILSGMLK